MASKLHITANQLLSPNPIAASTAVFLCGKAIACHLLKPTKSACHKQSYLNAPPSILKLVGMAVKTQQKILSQLANGVIKEGIKGSKHQVLVLISGW